MLTISKTYISRIGLSFLILRRSKDEFLGLGLKFLGPEIEPKVEELRLWFSPQGKCLEINKPSLRTQDLRGYDLYLDFMPLKNVRTNKLLTLTFEDKFPVNWSDDEIKTYILECLGMESDNLNVREIKIENL